MYKTSLVQCSEEHGKSWKDEEKECRSNYREVVVMVEEGEEMESVDEEGLSVRFCLNAGGRDG